MVVLAAGQGTRMRSARAKVLHELGGRALLRHVLAAVSPLGSTSTVVVVGHQAEAVEASLAGSDLKFALQNEQRGTGHAVMVARDAALQGFEGDVLVLYGDVPLLETDTLKGLVESHRAAGATLSLLTTTLEDPMGYGRILRDTEGRVVGIVEQKDADPAAQAIKEVNPGIYCVASRFLFEALDQLRPNNAQGELYLTDVVAHAVSAKEKVESRPVDAAEVVGVNSRTDLANLETLLRRRTVARHLDAGVSFLDPESAHIDVEVEIGSDTIIGPWVQLRGRTRIGQNCRLLGNAFIVDSEIGAGTELKPFVSLSGCRIGDDCAIGPFSQLRPGAELDRAVHIGNFVEVKKSTLGEGTKANHLAYLGDATIGRGVNIGAGTITCNYDGFAKHRTTIGDRVQIGSDSQLVAPVTIGDDAYVATGTTVRHDVEPGALAFNPKPDQRREGWVEAFRRRRGGKT